MKITVIFLGVFVVVLLFATLLTILKKRKIYTLLKKQQVQKKFAGSNAEYADAIENLNTKDTFYSVLSKYIITTFITFFVLFIILLFVWKYNTERTKSGSGNTVIALDSSAQQLIKNYIAAIQPKNINPTDIDGYRFKDSLELSNFRSAISENTKKLNEIQKFLDKHTAKKGSLLQILIPAIIFCIAGLLFYFFYFKKNRKFLAIASATLAFPINEIFGNLIDGEIKLWPEPTINYIQNNVDNSQQNASGNFLVDTILIGPFIEGMNYLQPDSIAFKKEELIRQLSRRNYKELIISAGVDIRPPINKSKKLYGDNLSLAQARAIYIKELIKLDLPGIDKNRIIPIAAGATNFSEQTDSLVHESNRTAYIFAKY